MLISKGKPKNDQNNQKDDKKNADPNNALVVLLVQFDVLFIGKGNDGEKYNGKDCSKNDLTGAEHKVMFTAVRRCFRKGKAIVAVPVCCLPCRAF
ncbi:hypothetical protein [Maribacter sp. 2307ULW6-5]|uniref:hypothetical protein n=1 Tax=Maribacter sp. 2307ULW6-5 TaxID=3386275 RepID=UPI0039BC60A6